MSKVRRKIVAEPLIENSSVPTEMYPGVGYEQDSSVHAPKAPDVGKPKNPDQGFLKEVKEEAADDDMVLTQPIKYIIDPQDAIDKMGALSRKVEQSRPDLAPQVAVVEQALQQLEQGNAGQAMVEQEVAEQAPAFAEGDRVSVTLEDGVYEGMVEKANEDGTFAVRTDQAMTLQNVPPTSMQKAEAQSMLLPASLQMRLKAARMVTDAIAQAFMEGKKRRIANTSTDGQTIWLHNNPIVRKAADGTVEISLAGWPTATTRERLNGVLSTLGIDQRVSQRGGNQMLNGKPWDGEWTSVGKPAPSDGGDLTDDKIAVNELGKVEGKRMRSKKFKAGRRVKAAEGLDVMPMAEKLAALIGGEKPKHVGEWRYSDKNDSAIIMTHTPELSLPVRILVSVFEDGTASISPFQGGKSMGSDAEGTSEMDRFEGLSNLDVDDTSDESIAMMVEDVQWIWSEVDSMSSSWDEDEAVQAMLKTMAAKGKGDQPEVVMKNRKGIVAAESPALPSGGAKAKAGYEKTGVFIVEEGGQPRAFDPEKDDVEPAELMMNEVGKLALANPNGETTYEEQANDDLELSYWATVKGFAPKAGGQQPEPAAPAPEPEPAKTEEKSPANQEAVAASAKATAKAAREKIKAAKAVKAGVKASAFDEIGEIEIGGGFKARRKKSAKEGGAEGEETAEIEVVDAEGKVKDTFPDAFGDDTVMIIKFLRQVLDIKEDDDKAAAKSEGGDKGGDGDIAEKPRALPATDEAKPKSEKDKEEEQVQAKKMEARLDGIRMIATRLLRSGHIQANLDDVDDGLVKGLTLAGAQAVAAQKAVDRKVLDLLAQPEDELLLIKASLPHLPDRRVTVHASDGGLGPINISAGGVIDVSGEQSNVGIGAAFGRGFRR